MKANPKIFVVEDDQELRDALVQRLSHGFQPVPVSDAGELFARLQEDPQADAILLDVLLPDDDGLAICQKIRKGKDRFSDIPIIMLSALGDPTDRVAGLHAGADDYIAKPFFTAELIARIYAVLRRCRSEETDPLQIEQPCFGEWQINRRARQLTNANGLMVMLTQSDYKLLSFFIEHPGKVFTREELAEHLSIRSNDLNIINVRIRRLREKLGETKEHPYIKCVRNEGYTWVMPISGQNHA